VIPASRFQFGFVGDAPGGDGGEVGVADSEADRGVPVSRPGPHLRRGSDRGPAAVGGDDRAGHVAGPGRGEERDDLGDLDRLSGPGQQCGVAERGDAVR